VGTALPKKIMRHKEKERGIDSIRIDPTLALSFQIERYAHLFVIAAGGADPQLVITGPVPVISIGRTPRLSDRDGRDKPGHDTVRDRQSGHHFADQRHTQL
jgi:hypothetical protein